MVRDSDLVLIGIGEAGYNLRPPTAEELEAYEASKELEELEKQETSTS